MHERRGADGAARLGQSLGPRKGAIYEEERAETATTMEPYKWYPQRAGRVDSDRNARRRPAASTIRSCARRSPSC